MVNNFVANVEGIFYSPLYLSTDYCLCLRKSLIFCIFILYPPSSLIAVTSYFFFSVDSLDFSMQRMADNQQG